MYIGNEIIELDGEGKIRSVSPDKFLDSSVYRTGTKIFIACTETGEVLSDFEIKSRARGVLGKRREYNPILDNCHQFTSGCITGDFENSDSFFWMLVDTIEKEMNDGNNVVWIPWDREY